MFSFSWEASFVANHKICRLFFCRLIFLMKTGNKSRNWFCSTMEEMASGIKRRNFYVLEFLIIFLCEISSKFTTQSSWQTWVNHLNRKSRSTIHRKTIRVHLCQSSPSFVFGFNLLWHNKNLHCEHNEIWCNKSNPIHKISFPMHS